jgi:hypothetical protein
MPSLILPRLISCDDAGYTGPDLLNPDQPFFSYASHDLSLVEADAVITTVRAKYRVQMPELKARKLLRSAQGRTLIADVLDRIYGRHTASLFDKRLSLMSKLFEYIYEPAGVGAELSGSFWPRLAGSRLATLCCGHAGADILVRLACRLRLTHDRCFPCRPKAVTRLRPNAPRKPETHAP